MTNNITLPRATVQQALEALENSSPDQYPEDAGVFYDAITALKAALEQQAEPVSHAAIAGALFDFMGWLTTRKERLVLSSTDNASPAVESITEFAKMRGLSLDDAKVQDWNTSLPQQQAEPVATFQDGVLEGQLREREYWVKQQAEPVAWLYKIVDAGLFVSDQQQSDVEVWNDVEWSKPLYTTPPQRQWVGLTKVQRDDFADAYGSYESVCAIEQALKERNT